MQPRTFISCLLMVLLIACSGGRKSEWDDLDYSSVYQRYEGRQNDSAYTPPRVINCVDEDLYNCN